MDALAAYDDDDGEVEPEAATARPDDPMQADEEREPGTTGRSLIAPAPHDQKRMGPPSRPSQATAAPLPAPAFKLPSPDFDGSGEGPSTSAPYFPPSAAGAGGGAPKRQLPVQAQGIAPSQGKAKTPKTSPSQPGPRAASGVLLPPQLRGRSNVSTEDTDKLFTKKSLAAAAAAAASKGSPS